MTRDEFKDQLQELITLANQEQLPMITMWGVLSEQLKLVELLFEIEMVAQYKTAQSEINIKEPT